MKQVVFICPFNLERLTGTPISATTTIHAVEEFASVSIISSDQTDNFITFTRHGLAVLRQQQPDIVHGFTSISILPMLWYKIFFNQKVKIVFEMHGWAWLELGSKSPFFKRFVFLCLDYIGLWFSSLVIAISLRQKDFLIKRTWRPERIVVQWCAVEFPGQFKLSPLGQSLRVGYIGNNSWWQGLPHLIDAAKILSDRSDISFSLAGFDFKDEQAFPRLKNVTYFGKINRENVMNFLQDCDVLILPRLKEPVSDLQFPQKLSEYLSAGRPVIASAVGDQPAILKEAGCGILVDPLNAKNLAQAIISFAGLPSAEKRLWGERAFTFARRHFFFEVLVNNLQDFYRRLQRKDYQFRSFKNKISKKKALVIGAGIHGTTIAIELGKENYDVTIIDSNSGVLMGTSGATHNRVHLGYHYPRSVKTALECKTGHQYFRKHFADSLIYTDFYYAVEKKQSKLSAQQYTDFMDKIGLPYINEWPNESFLNRNVIESSFKVREGYFDILKLKETIKKRFVDYDVKTNFNFSIQRAELTNNKAIKLYSDKDDTLEIETDLIINATYTNTNRVQKAFGMEDYLTEYEFENTEVAVVECSYEIPPLMVMDGPFVTIIPFGGYQGKYLVYDVTNSVTSRDYGVECVFPKDRKSNWPLMLQHGLQYYPFFKDLKYKQSLWGSRPIPLTKEAQNDDDRTTRIVKHDYPIHFYSILEGKLMSAPMIAEDLVSRIKKEIHE